MSVTHPSISADIFHGVGRRPAKIWYVFGSCRGMEIQVHGKAMHRTHTWPYSETIQTLQVRDDKRSNDSISYVSRYHLSHLAVAVRPKAFLRIIHVLVYLRKTSGTEFPLTVTSHDSDLGLSYDGP